MAAKLFNSLDTNSSLSSIFTFEPLKFLNFQIHETSNEIAGHLLLFKNLDPGSLIQFYVLFISAFKVTMKS